MVKAHLLERMVHDIKFLLEDDKETEEKIMYLWDDKKETVDFGKQYGGNDVK